MKLVTEDNFGRVLQEYCEREGIVLLRREDLAQLMSGMAFICQSLEQQERGDKPPEQGGGNLIIVPGRGG